MKLLHFSDTHGKHLKMHLHLKEKPHVAIFSGDLTNAGERWQIEDFLEWFADIPADYHVFVGGNHDLSMDPWRGTNNGHIPEWLRDELLRFESKEGNFYLENSSVVIDGVKFWGSPITPWFYGEYWAFNKHRTDSEIGEVWKQIPHDTDVLITHGPPYGKLDRVIIGDKLVGCERLAYHIKRVKPLLNLFGHIHEAYGCDQDVHTHYFNGSILDLSYKIKNEPWLLDVDFKEKAVKILNHSEKEEQKKNIVDIMKADEEAGLYD